MKKFFMYLRHFAEVFSTWVMGTLSIGFLAVIAFSVLTNADDINPRYPGMEVLGYSVKDKIEYTYLYDPETRVRYVLVKNGKSTTITVMYDQDGKPLLNTSY